MGDHNRLASLRRAHWTAIPGLTLVCTIIDSGGAYISKWLQLRQGIARSRLVRLFGTSCGQSLTWEYAGLVYWRMSDLQPVQTMVKIVLPANTSAVSRGRSRNFNWS